MDLAWADLNLKLFASIDPHHDAVILELYLGFKSDVTYYYGLNINLLIC